MVAIAKYKRLIALGMLAWASNMNVAPALAATSKSSNMDGTVAKLCGLSASSVTLAIKITGNGGTKTYTFSPASVTAICNGPLGGTLTVSSPGANNGATFIPYTLTVSNFGSPISFTTTTNATKTSSSSGASARTSVTLAFSASTTDNNNTNTSDAVINLSIVAN